VRETGHKKGILPKGDGEASWNGGYTCQEHKGAPWPSNKKSALIRQALRQIFRHGESLIFGLMVITGHGDFLTTFSATLPIRICSMPLLPCVPITTRSIPSALIYSMISTKGAPALITVFAGISIPLRPYQSSVSPPFL
jgi:hypothetical protein